MWKKTWIILLLVLTIVTWRNYPWGTSLLGWDSVQPELNFGINLRRALSNVWVENQGVGHIGGHGYATILVQGMIEWVIHLVVGVVQTRGVLIFAMLWFGPIGIYVLWKRWFPHTGKFIEWGALLASLFYLLNLGTVQVFYAPLEAFTAMYGLLPWAIWSIVQYWQAPRLKSLLILLFIQIIFSMIGFIPPQFVAYGMVFVALSIGYVLGQRKSWWIAVKRVLVAGVVAMIANAYWLLPIAYYSVYGASNYVNAKNNQVSTPDFQYMSEARGTWRDVALMRGFFIDSSDSVIKGEGKFFEIFEPWNNYLRGNIEWVGYGLFVVVMMGMVGMLLTKGKRSIGVGLTLVLVIGWMAVAQAEEPFRTMATMIHGVPIVGQAFRAAFTKFLCLLILGYSVGFGYGVWTIYKIFREKVALGILLVFLGIGSLVIYMWLMFKGNLIYERMKVKMPEEYMKVVRYFDGVNKQARIAYLQSAWMWGWQVHEWGYSGSGFLWYGIEQPILDRAFDVWSPYNEGFYNEFSTALYGEKKDDVEKVIKKYDVRYVLLDESVIAPGQGKEILRIEETKKLASELGWSEKFQEGFLTVWDTGIGNEGYVSAPATYTLVEGDTGKVREDVIWEDVGHYVSAGTQSRGVTVSQITYPFAQLMREEVGGAVWSDDGVQFTANGLRPGQELIIPGWKKGEWVELGYKVSWQEGTIKIDWEPVYRAGDFLHKKLEAYDDLRGPQLPTLTYPVRTDQKSVWVQIAESKAIYVRTGEQGEGRVRLQVGYPVETRVFAGEGQEIITKVGQEQRCGENKDLRCWATPLTKATQDELLQTITHYDGRVSPEVCLDLEGEPYDCVNFTRRGVSPIVVTTHVMRGERYWVDWVARESKTNPKGLGVVRYPQIEKYEMGAEWWGEFLADSRFKMTDSSLVIEVVGRATEYDFSRQGKPTINNCDVLSRGSAAKNGSTYTADERGAACDHVEMSELDTRLPYLMRMVGENKEGRSIKFFLWNTGSKRNDLDYLLGKNQFDQTFALMPWDFGGSYSLNIETRSFGEQAENKLEPVEVRYFPLKQIAGARIDDRRQMTDSRIENHLRINEVDKTGTWLYRVKTSETGLLRLSQGYDEGWVGWGIKHVKVDGWANGWMVDNTRSEYWIFYWPQILEYLGFGALGVTIIWLVRKQN